MNLLRTTPLAALLCGALLSQQTQQVFYGDSAGDRFGYSLQAIGDLDGDGIDEVIVGAPFDDHNGTKAGSAHVYSGATGTVLFSYDGAFAGDEFGYSVGPAGDVDGDGIPDFYSGILRGADRFRGLADVYSGATGELLLRLEGQNGYDYFGLAVTGLGDLDGDGYDDLAIGVPGADVQGSSSGSVQVYSGATGTLLWEAHGDTGGNQLGWYLCGLGDVDDDGYRDLVAGAPFGNGGGPVWNSGYARVFSGRTGTVLMTLHGTQSDSRFGWCVGNAGDVDKDGHDDVIVGAHLHDGVGADSGRAFVFSGADASLLWTFDGEAAGDQFGWSVARAGDVNGDGHADLIVGARWADTNGIDSGSAHIFSGLDGSELVRLDGHSEGDWFGFAVGPAGDIDGNGFADVIIGAMLDDASGAPSGSAVIYVFSGATQPPKARVFGAGCPGSDGRLPRIDIRGRAALGGTFDVLGGGMLPDATVFLNVGLLWGEPLDPVAPGCFAHAYPLQIDSTVADPSGFVRVTPSVANPLPNDPAFLNIELVFQWLALDAANNVLGVSTSNAVRVTLGSYH